MTRAPRSRRRLVLAAAAAVLLTASSQVAMAAPRGTQVEVTVTSLVSVVSTGQTSAFDATIRNAGSSTIANLRFHGTASGGTLEDAPAGCGGSGPEVECSLPNLPGGSSMTLRLLFSAPTSAGQLTLEGVFSAEGGKDDPGGSQDTWHASGTTTVSDSADLFGRWQRAHGNLTFPAVGNAGGQRTIVSTPPVGFDYAVLVQHNDEAVECGGGALVGVGRTVELSVAEGRSPVTLQIEYGADVSGDLKPNSIQIVHQHDDGVTCTFPPRGCKVSPGFCYDAAWSGKGKNRILVVHVEIPHNGKIKGF